MESANANFEIKLVALSMRIWRYAHLLVERLRGKRRSDSVRPYRQNSILSETSLLLSFGIVGGWLLSRLFPKRRQSSVTLSRKAERHPSQPISSVHATEHVKGGRGILSLAIELLGAVAISL